MCVKSGVTDDARVHRMASTLAAAGYEVGVIGDRPGTGVADPKISVWHVAQRAEPRLTNVRTARWFRSIRWLLLPVHRRRDDDRFIAAVEAFEVPWKPDIVHAHDLSGLRAVASRIDKTTTVVYDTHECWTERSLEGRPQPLIDRDDLRDEQLLGSAASVVFTVSDALAEWLYEAHRWTNVVVVRNTFEVASDRPVERQFRPSGLLYAGRIDEERDLRTVCAAAEKLRDLTLVVRGSGDDSSIASLRDQGVSVLAPLSIDEISREYRRLGIAVVSLSGATKNHEVALPNKLFHAVQAGVPVVAADLPQLRAIVGEFGLGELYEPGNADSFERAVRGVVDGYPAFVESVVRAQRHLSWEHDSRMLLQAYEALPISC